MVKSTKARRRGFVWALAGGVVLVGAILAMLLSVWLSPSDGPAPTDGPGSSPSVSPARSTSPGAGGPVVDDSVSERGWRPEPITGDPEAYAPAALEAASTFDTRASTRAEWVDWLSTWFTTPTQYTDPAEREDAKRGFLAELRSHVLIPAEEWDSLGRENGTVVGRADGDVTFLEDAQFEALGIHTATADVVLTFTRDADADGSDRVSYEERVRVSVQVMCGVATDPVPDSAQRSGDCKVVRFFTEPVG